MLKPGMVAMNSYNDSTVTAHETPIWITSQIMLDSGIDWTQDYIRLYLLYPGDCNRISTVANVWRQGHPVVICGNANCWTWD